MKKASLFLIAALLTLQLSACNPQNQTTDSSDSNQQISDTTSQESVTSEDEQEDDAEFSPAPGETPFDFPTDVELDAAAEDFVLAPSYASLKDAFKNKGENSVMIFYNRVLKEVGEQSSVLEEFSGDVSMPNSLIIPIHSGETAEVGDIVLTWWQSGSGLTRAIVVEGGSAREPMVKYLDLSFDYDPERLKLDSFHVLTDELEPGTTIAARKSGDYNQATVISVSGDQVLASGFGSIISVYNSDDVTPLPIHPDIEVGDEVHVPIVGKYKLGTVTEIDEVNGRATVEYDWAGSTSVDDFAFGDIATEL